MRVEGVMLSTPVAGLGKHSSKLNAFKNIPFRHLPSPAQLLIIILFSFHSPQSGFIYISSYPLNKQLGNQTLEARFPWSVQGKSREGWSGGSRGAGQPRMVQGGWNKMRFKVTSNPNHSRIL